MTILEQRINHFLSTLFRYIEKAILVSIGGFALIGIGQLVHTMYTDGAVHLQDLLLMFIFVEIMAMANVYFQRHSVPFTYPMLIAVTALSRLVVLQGKNVGPENLLYESGAILLITVAILVMRFGERYRNLDSGE